MRGQKHWADALESKLGDWLKIKLDGPGKYAFRSNENRNLYFRAHAANSRVFIETENETLRDNLFDILSGDMKATYLDDTVFAFSYEKP